MITAYKTDYKPESYSLSRFLYNEFCTLDKIDERRIMILMNKKTSPQIKMNLKSLLDKRGLTVDAVVKMCNDAGSKITRTTVYNLKSDHAKGVKFSSLTALCNGLQVPPADLFTYEDSK